MQRQSAGSLHPAATTPQALAPQGRAGQALDAATRGEMERGFGHDFSAVRVHADADANRAARAEGAWAYTLGRDIVFERDQYAPASPAGRRLLAHELAHVVQQSRAAGPALSEAAAEAEADRAAEQVLAGGPRPVLSAVAAGPARLQRDAKPASSLDASAQAIVDAAKDSKAEPDEAKRAVALVRAILDTYYPSESNKVSQIVYERGDPGLATQPVGTGANLTGKITVGHYFIANVDSFARRVLQVGHELQHVDQQRGGMGGGTKRDKREYLAFSWEALQTAKAGTGRVGYGMTRDMIDCALGYLNCLSADEQAAEAANKTKLLDKRKTVNGKGGHPATEPPTGCERCDDKTAAPAGGSSAPAGKAGAGAMNVQPAPTQVAAATGQAQAGKAKDDDGKVEFSLAAGGETETGGDGTEATAKLSFEASIPLADLIAPGKLETRALLAGAPLKFFDELSFEPSAGLRRGTPLHPLLTPLAIEASLKMISIEWKGNTRLGRLEGGFGLSAVAAGGYVPQTREGSVETSGELGGEIEYRPSEKSPWFLKVEAKGAAKFGKTGDAEFRWEGVSFSTGAKVGVSF